MGVTGLMDFAKNAIVKTDIVEAKLPGSSAAVDVSHWMYKACYNFPEACYHKQNMNIVYKGILDYIDRYVKMLRHHEVELTFVFDGMRLPAKRITHDERKLKKMEARKMVEQHLSAGNREDALKFMKSCIEIKYDTLQQVILYCKREQINYVVAPYEADAQLAFLNLNGSCDFVITEDTDLILYGCTRIIYKLESPSGACMLYEKLKLSKCLGTREDLEFQKFRRICIMSGCDYIKNIPSIGLQRAKKFFLMTHQDNLHLLLPKIPTYLKAPALKGKVTEEYVNGFINAELTFRHHIVYDPLNHKLRPLEPYPRGKSSSDFPMAGKRFHSTLAKEIVRGNIDLDRINQDTDLDSASDASDLDGPDTDDEQQAQPQAKYSNNGDIGAFHQQPNQAQMASL